MSALMVESLTTYEIEDGLLVLAHGTGGRITMFTPDEARAAAAVLLKAANEFDEKLVIESGRRPIWVSDSRREDLPSTRYWLCTQTSEKGGTTIFLMPEREAARKPTHPGDRWRSYEFQQEVIGLFDLVSEHLGLDGNRRCLFAEVQ